MSWMQILSDIYDQQAASGKVGEERDGQPMLLPLYHVEMQAQIELTIDKDGRFLGAEVITNKADSLTVMPCTEKSAARANGINPMPLFDKLLYIAGDYNRYSPVENKRSKECYEAYTAALEEWCQSPYVKPEILAWQRYVSKGTMISDLIACGVLKTDEDGKVPEKWQKDGKPLIYTAVTNAPLDAVVRFRVVGVADEDRVWMNGQIREAFVNWQDSLSEHKALCYATGKVMAPASAHPKYIRYGGDGAKLISFNDKAGFTFRGRFATPDEAVTIGRDTTQKAHVALKWLIQRQGYRNGEQVIVAFTAADEALPPLMCSSLDLESEFVPQMTAEPTTGRQLAIRIRNSLAGYGCAIKPDDVAVVMGLDSATPGRLSIFYYREMRADDLLGRICRWHSECAWRHTWLYAEDGLDDAGKKIYRRKPFTGAPAPKDIVTAAYGENVSDKLMKSAVERLLPCIVDGARLPVDMMRCAARNAAKPAQHTDTEQRKALEIACALIRKHYNEGKAKEEWSMALETDITDRSYLFGRALAYAEQIEREALTAMEENRPTNAERMMPVFARRPEKIWKQLMERLRPYQNKLGIKAVELEKGMNAVLEQMAYGDFSNVPLNGKYLLGYACQKHTLNNKNSAARKAKETTDTNDTEEA